MSEIAEIRARHEAGERASAAADREWLLGEVERLREAVQWYGERARSLSGADNKYPFSDLFEDAGKRARDAMEDGR